VKFCPEYQGQFRTGSIDGIALGRAVHKSDYAAVGKIGSAPVFIGLYKDYGSASVRKHLLGICSKHQSFEPSAPMRAQDDEILFELLGMLGDAPGHIALRDFVHMHRNTHPPALDSFGYQRQIPFSARNVLEMSVTMYAARRVFLDHVKQFDRASKPFGESPHNRENRFGEF
jgi:hypothetical protein